MLLRYTFALNLCVWCNFFPVTIYPVHTVFEAGSSTISIKEARTGKKVTPTPGPYDSQSLTEDDQKHLNEGID